MVTLQSVFPKTASAPATIAVVEDVEDNRSVLRALLDGYYNIHEFENGAAFVASLDQTNYDLVLLDLSMPGMDGFGVLERVQNHPTQRFIPVIAVTARAMHGDREKALAVGFRDYVTKPFDFDVILACIRRHLSS